MDKWPAAAAMCRAVAPYLDVIVIDHNNHEDNDKLLILGSNTGSGSEKQGNSRSVAVEASLNIFSLYIHLFINFSVV